MTARTRYFILGSVLVLVVGLSIGVVAYYGGVSGKLFGSAPGPADDLRYIPEDAAVVAYADVRQVMTSELRQRLRQMPGQSDEGRKEFSDKTGIDIERDIDSVVGFVGPKAAEGANTSGLLLARGRFDAARIEQFAKTNGAQIGDYKGQRIITHKAGEAHGEARPGESEMAVAFMEPGLVAIGSATAVRRAIDQKVGKGQSLVNNQDMMKHITDIGDGSMWAVGKFDAITNQAHLPAEVSSRIPPITWFSASGRVNGGLHAVLKAQTNDEQSANNLRDIVRGFVALAKMQTGSKPEAQALWPNIELGGQGTEVSVSFSVSSALLDVLGDAAKKAPKKAPAAPGKGEAD
jgi:hypothetical protein